MNVLLCDTHLTFIWLSREFHVTIKYHLTSPHLTSPVTPNPTSYFILFNIYNELFLTDTYPSNWKNSFIHFIAIPNGKGMRLIALSSCVAKLFDSLITNRLNYWLEINKYLPPNQSGFRKGKSCMDNLKVLLLNIQ